MQHAFVCWYKYQAWQQRGYTSCLLLVIWSLIKYGWNGNLDQVQDWLPAWSVGWCGLLEATKASYSECLIHDIMMLTKFWYHTSQYCLLPPAPVCKAKVSRRICKTKVSRRNKHHAIMYDTICMPVPLSLVNRLG